MWNIQPAIGERLCQRCRIHSWRKRRDSLLVEIGTGESGSVFCAPHTQVAIGSACVVGVRLLTSCLLRCILNPDWEDILETGRLAECEYISKRSYIYKLLKISRVSWLMSHMTELANGLTYDARTNDRCHFLGRTSLGQRGQSTGTLWGGRYSQAGAASSTECGVEISRLTSMVL